MSSISENLRLVKGRIAAAAARAGRDPSEVTLVAVTKNVDAGRVALAAKAGVSDFGENRVQEAAEKIPLVDADVAWHFVGHLQRNKARDAVELFSLIHSLDSMKLAHELNRRCEMADSSTDLLLQVNISGEETKFGVPPEMAKDSLLEVARYERLRVRGLMTIAPYSDDPEDARPWFSQARQLMGELGRLSISNVRMDELSMGMSGDYEVAIEEGATIIRVGTAIFGERR
ncbi:MAG: YggS family pyridoxal phosphate-dependent enzyme [Firmicutes bacterium]|nr:YggS family pyridoxal phosphate-dependent enzyme [Bacillota bacterium]MDD4792444.1 YggS family pyridoxal phosphate-dependent enzyme [Bacillota bacterium]